MTSQRWFRIIPVAFVMYTIAFIDRNNVALALPQMVHDLGMKPETAGDSVGIFFWGYLLLQIPGGYLAHRWSAKWFVSILLVCWGACAVVCGYARTPGEFMVARFMLGVAEGGVWPAVLVMLSQWFPRAERARANAFWMLCLPLSVAISSPISGWIIDHWSWRTMLIAEGALPFVWLVVWLALIHDHPKTAPWISKEERSYLESTLQREAAELIPVRPEPYLRSLFHPVVITLIGVYFLLNCGAYGYNGWLPSAIKKTIEAQSPGMPVRGQGNNLVVGLLNAVPYIITAFAMVFVARYSDRTRQRRRPVILGSIWGGILFALSVATQKSPWLSFALVSLVLAGPWSGLAPFWAIPAESLPPGVAASSMGLINALGNLGGYFGPYLVGYIRQNSANPDDYTLPFLALALCFVLAGCIAMLLPKSSSPPARTSSPG